MMGISYDGGIGSIKPIGKGTSRDQKYIITTSEGRKFQLRLSGIDAFEHTKEVASLLKALAAKDIPAQRLIDFGAGDGKVYLAMEWCEGKDAEAVVPALPAQEQYDLGLHAGKILRKVHSMPVPDQHDNWADRIELLTRQRIQDYKSSGYHFDGDEVAIKYLEDNALLVRYRPQSLRHSDYHFSNIVVSEEKALTLIDWDCCGYGDPWEEFQQTAWIVAASPLFAIGQLHGYFDGDPPAEFFPILAFYMASCAIWSIPWCEANKKEYVEYMIARATDTVKWFDKFARVCPSWYIPAGTIDANTAVDKGRHIKEDSDMPFDFLGESQGLAAKKAQAKKELDEKLAEEERRRQEEKRIAAEWARKWSESGVSERDIIVQPCPLEYQEVIDGVFPHLRFPAPMFFALAPDGTYRIHHVAAGSASNCSAFIIEASYTASSGKSSSTYTDEVWILSNRYMRIVSEGAGLASPDGLRQWFVNWGSEGMPATNYEKRIAAKTTTPQGQTQAQRWAAQGLCIHCGGKISTWSNKCKSCGRYR